MDLDLGDLGRVQQGRGLPGGLPGALCGGEGHDVHPAVRPGDAEAPGGELDVRDRGLQRFGGGLPALLDHARGGDQDGLPLRIEAPGPAGAAAGRDRVGVALADADLVAVDAELVDRELDVGGLVPLARRLRADEHVDVAVFGEADLGTLGRRAAGRLEIVGHADPALLALRRTARAATLEAGPVHLGQRRVHDLLEVAAVVGLLHRRHVGHGGGGDHVAAAECDAVDAHLARRGIDQPFDDVVALRPPGPAIGVDRDGVGERAEHVGVDGLEVVDAGEDLRPGAGRDERRVVRQVRPHVGDVADAHGEERAVLVERQLTLPDVVAAVRVRQERLAPLARPPDGAAELAGGVADQDLLGIQEQLHAEAAAHVGGHDADAVLVDVEDGLGEHRLDAPAALRVGVEREAAVLERGDGGAGLH